MTLHSTKEGSSGLAGPLRFTFPNIAVSFVKTWYFTPKLRLFSALALNSAQESPAATWKICFELVTGKSEALKSRVVSS
jgi:hypothetical protein